VIWLAIPALAAAAYQAKLKQWDSDVALARKMGEEPPAKPIPVGVAITAPPKSDATAAADKVVNDFVTQTTSPASVESATTAFQTLINDGVAGITTTDQLASYTSAGEKAAQTVLDGLNEKVATFTTYGEAIGEAWVKGVVDAITNGKLTISTAAQGATKGLAGSSPPTEGPLHEIDVWGANVGSAWVGPFVAKIAGAAATAAKISRPVPPTSLARRRSWMAFSSRRRRRWMDGRAWKASSSPAMRAR